MGEDESLERKHLHDQSERVKDYDAIRSTKRQLSGENLKSASDLIDISVQLLKETKADEKTGFRTQYVMTRKNVGTNFFNRKEDPNGNRLYVMVRDLNKLGMDQTEGLIVEYAKLSPTQEIISRGHWTLPRSGHLAQEQFLWDLKSKDQDWEIIDELTSSLKNNLEIYGKRMYIEEDEYKKKIGE